MCKCKIKTQLRLEVLSTPKQLIRCYKATEPLSFTQTLVYRKKSFVGKPYLSQYLRDPKLAPLEESPETPKCFL